MLNWDNIEMLDTLKSNWNGSDKLRTQAKQLNENMKNDIKWHLCYGIRDITQPSKSVNIMPEAENGSADCSDNSMLFTTEKNAKQIKEGSFIWKMGTYELSCFTRLLSSSKKCYINTNYYKTWSHRNPFSSGQTFRLTVGLLWTHQVPSSKKYVPLGPSCKEICGSWLAEHLIKEHTEISFRWCLLLQLERTSSHGKNK